MSWCMLYIDFKSFTTKQWNIVTFINMDESEKYKSSKCQIMYMVWFHLHKVKKENKRLTQNMEQWSSQEKECGGNGEGHQRSPGV